MSDKITYTVVGAWVNGVPLAVGVIVGEHQVAGGDEFWEEGPWATHVQAANFEEAERLACQEMADEESDEDEEEPVRGCSCGMADYGAPGHDGSPDRDLGNARLNLRAITRVAPWWRG